MRAAAEEEVKKGIPVEVEGVTIATIPPESDMTPEDVLDFANSPADMAMLARNGKITLPEVVAPIEGVDLAITEEMNERVAASAALAPQTVEALKTAPAPEAQAETAEPIETVGAEAAETPVVEPVEEVKPAETLGVTPPPAPTLEASEGAARNADIIRQARARMAGTEQGPRVGLIPQPSVKLNLTPDESGATGAGMKEEIQQTPAETEQEKAKREYQEYVDRVYRPTWGTTSKGETAETPREQPQRLTDEEMEKIRSAAAKGRSQEAVDEINRAKATAPQPITPTGEAPTTATEGQPMPGGSSEWSPTPGQPATANINGQKVVGTVGPSTGKGLVSFQYEWNGRTQKATVRPDRLSSPVASLTDPPRYQYTQEQNTRKMAKHFPSALGVHANHDFRKSFASMAKDKSLNRIYQKIAEVLSKMPAFANVDLHVVADENQAYAGEYSFDNGKASIGVNLRQVGRGRVDALGTLLHEALHHVTLAKVRDPQGTWENEVLDKLDTIRGKVLEFAKSQGLDQRLDYELGTVEEFITAVFTRPDFQNFLASIPDSFSTGVAVGKFRSVLSEVFRLITEFLSGEPVARGSTMEQSMTTILAMFETPFRAVETGKLEALNAVQSGAQQATPESIRHAELEAKFNAGTITSEETAEAQRLVDERAKAAGYGVGPMWHGSAEQFNEFDKSRWGESDEGYLGAGFYFTNKPEVAQWYTKGSPNASIYRVFLKQKRPANIGMVNGKRADIAQYAQDLTGQTFDRYDRSPEMSVKITQALQRFGIDGIDYTFRDGSKELTVFEPSAIKSADPFTGVPLDQRFDEKSNDIRASRAEGRKYRSPTDMLAEAAQRAKGEAVGTKPQGLASMFNPQAKRPATGERKLLDMPTRSVLTDAYREAVRGSSTQMAPLSSVYAQARLLQPGLTPEAFLAQVQEGYDNGTLLLEGAGSQQEAAQSSLSLPGTPVGTAVRMMPAPQGTVKSLAEDQEAYEADVPTGENAIRVVDNKYDKLRFVRSIGTMDETAKQRIRNTLLSDEGLTRELGDAVGLPKWQSDPVKKLVDMLFKSAERYAENTDASANQEPNLWAQSRIGGGTLKSKADDGEPPIIDIGGEAEPADGKGKQLYQKNPTAIGDTYISPADITLQEKKTQQETLDAARKIIGEEIAKNPNNTLAGRRAALNRFRLDTSIPPQVRAVGTGVIAQQADRMANLSEGTDQLLLDEMADEAAKLSGIMSSDLEAWRNLKADANLQIDKMAEEAGRTLNIFNVFRRLTPEGFLRRMTRKFNDAVREKVGQNFDVPAGEVEREIRKKLLLLRGGPSGRAKRHAKKITDALRNQKIAEKAIERIQDKLAGPQPEKGAINPVSELIGEHLSKEVPDFVEKVKALEVPEDVAKALNEVIAKMRSEVAALEKANSAEKAIKDLMKSLKPKPRAPREKIEKALKTLFTADTVGALDDQAFFDAFGEAFGMPPLSDEQQARIKKLIREVNALPKGPARLDKQQDLDEELALWKGIAARDVLLSAWYANILSGVSTQGMGLLGNALNFVPRSLFNMINNPRSAGAYFKGAFGEGLSTGLKEAQAAMKGRGLYKVSKYGDKNLVSALELLRKKGPSTLPEWVAYIASAGTRLRYVFRIMQAIDALAWNTAREGHAYLAAHRALLEQEKESGTKRSPEEFSRAFIDALGGDVAQIEEDLRAARQSLIDAGQTPSLLAVDRMAREARNLRRAASGVKAGNRFADRIVLQQDPEGSGKFISNLIEVFQKKDILGLPIGQLLIPFNRIVSNLFEQSLDYTPVGLVRAFLGGHLSDVKPGSFWNGKVEFKDKSQLFDQMERRERAMAAVTGMAAAAAIYALASAHEDEPDEDVPFMVYGWGPESKNKRAQMPKGWVPYSVKIGDNYIKFSEMPFGMMFAAAGSAMDAMRYKNMDKKTSTQRLAYVLKTAAKGFLNQGVMSSLDTAMETLMFDASEKKMADIPVNALKGLVPAQGMLRDISTIMDPNKVSSDSLTSALLRDIPFAKSWGTKPDLNVFGEPIKLDGYPITRRIITHREPHAVADYLGRNELSIPGMEQTIEIGKYLPDKAKDRIQARAVELGAMENGLFTPEQNYAFKKRAGELTKAAVQEIMKKTPKVANDEQRKQVQDNINKAVGIARNRAMLEAVPVK
jgi:hypothetical protein